MDRLSVYALLTICCLLVREGEAIQCYVCNSKQDTRCLNPLEGKSPLEPTDCNADQSVRAETRKAIEKISELLQKLGSSKLALAMDKNPAVIWESEHFPMACQKLELEVDGELVLGRGCSAPRMEMFDPCKAVNLITSDAISVQSCSICDTDGCNAGISLQAFSLGLFAVLLLLLVIT